MSFVVEAKDKVEHIIGPEDSPSFHRRERLTDTDTTLIPSPCSENAGKMLGGKFVFHVAIVRSHACLSLKEGADIYINSSATESW